jgi:hypothetical protein
MKKRKRKSLLPATRKIENFEKKIMDRILTDYPTIADYHNFLITDQRMFFGLDIHYLDRCKR